MKFRKYEFTNSEWQSQKVKIEKESEGEKYWDIEICASVIELGYLNESLKYSVDIIWQNDELISFTTYKVWPEPIGAHSFGYDIDSEYIKEYYILFPEPIKIS